MERGVRDKYQMESNSIEKKELTQRATEDTQRATEKNGTKC